MVRSQTLVTGRSLTGGCSGILIAVREATSLVPPLVIITPEATPLIRPIGAALIARLGHSIAASLTGPIVTSSLGGPKTTSLTALVVTPLESKRITLSAASTKISNLRATLVPGLERAAATTAGPIIVRLTKRALVVIAVTATSLRPITTIALPLKPSCIITRETSVALGTLCKAI